MQFGQILENLMRDNKTTAYKLSKAIGVSQSTIKNWIDGRMPDLTKAAKVSEYFNVTINYLLGNENDDKKDKPTDEVDELRAKLFSVIKGELTGEELLRVYDYVELVKAAQRNAPKK